MLALLGLPRNQAKPSITLRTLPAHVYKEPTPNPSIESWTVYVVVDGPAGIEPIKGSALLLSGSKTLQEITWGAGALQAIRGLSFRSTDPSDLTGKQFTNEPEQFDLKLRFEAPAAWKVDKVVFRLRTQTSTGKNPLETLEIPVAEYQPKTPLIFPFKGSFVVLSGAVSDFGHTEKSQQFALDVLPVSDTGAWVTGDGSKNEDFVGWGKEIIAPGDGTVVYARDDVPNQPKPGPVDMSLFSHLPDPVLAIGGNSVVINHGDGEFTYLAHMQSGSVRVHAGDKVKQGQTIGLLGSSGHANGPHLHFHLMSGPWIYRSDPLPMRFTNVQGALVRGGILEAK